MLKEFFVPCKIKAFLFLMHEVGLSQKESQRYIARGRLFVGGRPMTDPAAVIEGSVQCVLFVPVSRGIEPVFITNSFALYDKPSGVLVHPQNRNTDHCMIDEIRDRFGNAANIVHRIDQETSGLLLAAVDKASERTLKLIFENREIEKRYLALVHGRVGNDLIIDAPLVRRQSDSALVRMIVKVHEEGKPSKTYVRPLRYFGDLDMTLIEAKPLTGRQHQIRVHLFHVKHPIVGDPIYGQSDADILRFLDRELRAEERIEMSGASRLLLHANTLEFTFEGVRYKLKSRTDFLEDAFQAMSI